MIQTIVAMLILATGAWPQSNGLEPTDANPASQSPFAFRFERVRIQDLYRVGDCYFVMPDGSYRREHSEARIDTVSPHVPKGALDRAYVYVGVLTPDEMKDLTTLINNPAVRALVEPAMLRKSFDFLDGTIVRPGESQQNFRLGDDDLRSKKAALKPLLEWMRGMEKRRGDQVKEATGTGCKLPNKVNFFIQ